jgi:hypothetical protein
MEGTWDNDFMDKHGRAGGMLLERLPRRQRRVKGKPGGLRPYQRLRGSADYDLSRMRGASETHTTCWCERGHTIVRHNAGRKRNRDVQLGSTNLKTFEKHPMLYIKRSRIASSYDALLDLFLVLTPLVA